LESQCKEWLTLEEAADYLGVSYTRMVQKVNEGVYPVAIVPGFKNTQRISRTTLDEMLRQAEKPIEGGDRAGKRGRKPRVRKEPVAAHGSPSQGGD
jgi:excisionase family DNA binding protein